LYPEYFRRISLREERISAVSLCALFRRSDALRFGGGKVGREEVLSVLRALEVFISGLEEEEKARYKKSQAETVPAGAGNSASILASIPASIPGGKR
jgi:hypothetical protein